METLPLRVEEELHVFRKAHMLLETRREFFKGLRLPALHGLRPFRPILMLEIGLRRDEERIVVEPRRLARTERLVFRQFLAARLEEACVRFLQALMLERPDAREVDERTAALVEHFRLRGLEPALLHEVVEVDEHRIAREGRRRLIRRVAEIHGAERQDLPDLLPGLREEVEERIGRLAEVTDAVFRRQRGRMQQHARRTLVALRLDLLAQQHAMKGLHRHRYLPAHDIVTALRMERVDEDTLREVADIERHDPFLAAVAIENRDVGIVFRLFPEDVMTAADEAREREEIAVAIERQELARLERCMFVALLDVAAEPRLHIRIAVLPVVGAAVVGILEALHRDLVAVVDGGNARIRHLEEYGHQEARHTEIVVVVIHVVTRLLDGRHAVIERCLAEERERAHDIVTADEVHHRVEVFLRIVLAQALHAAHGETAVDVAHEEVKEMLAQRVVHRGIHLVAAEVLALLPVGDLVRGVLPNLADHHGVGIRRLEFLVERLREGRGQFVDDVEAPAADALSHPVVEHAVLAVDDEVHVGRRRLRDIGEGVEIPPALVVVRKVAEVVPLVVR